MNAPTGLPPLRDVGARVRAEHAATLSVRSENAALAAQLATAGEWTISVDGDVLGTRRGFTGSDRLDVDLVRAWARALQLGKIPDDPLGRSRLDDPAEAAAIAAEVGRLVQVDQVRRAARERAAPVTKSIARVQAERLLRRRHLVVDGAVLRWTLRTGDPVLMTTGAEAEHPDGRTGLFGRRREVAEEVTSDAVARVLRHERYDRLPGGEQPEPADVVVELRCLAGLSPEPNQGAGTGWLRARRG